MTQAFLPREGKNLRQGIKTEKTNWATAKADGRNNECSDQHVGQGQGILQRYALIVKSAMRKICREFLVCVWQVERRIKGDDLSGISVVSKSTVTKDIPR